LITAALHEFLPYARLDELAKTRAEEYASAQPFPHIVIDGLVGPAILEAVLAPGNWDLRDTQKRSPANRAAAMHWKRTDSLHRNENDACHGVPMIKCQPSAGKPDLLMVEEEAQKSYPRYRRARGDAINRKMMVLGDAAPERSSERLSDSDEGARPWVRSLQLLEMTPEKI
jgi:hypothetical protein